MELINKIATDFILFSLIEGFLYVFAFIKIQNIQIKNKQIVVLSIILGLINSIVSSLLPPGIYQIIMIGYMSMVLSLICNANMFKSIKSMFCILLFMLGFEVIFSLFFGLFDFKFEEMNDYFKFICFLPIRITEVIFIVKGVNYMKSWFGKIKK